MVEETLEAKLKRHEDALVACMAEIEKLRAENVRLRSESDAHTVLREIYSDPDAPQNNRVKAAAASLPFERPKLMPERAPLDLVAEPGECLADIVHRQRARMDRLLALPLKERSELFAPSCSNSGNGDAGNDDSSD